METLYFILGMLSVVTLIAVGGVVMMMVRMRSLKRELNDDLRDLVGTELSDMYSTFAKFEHEVNTEIDKFDNLVATTEHNVINYTDELNENAQREMDKIYAYVDSRTDKMADNVSKHIAELNRRVFDSDEKWALQNEGPTKD